MPEPIRYFVYARKSTDDNSRQLRSIEDQIAEVRLLAERLNLPIVETFTERQSAKHPGRPIFNEMLDRIERGEASGILSWHPDRLARNMMDGGRIIHLVDTRKLLDLKFPTCTFEPTAQGKYLLAMMLCQSKYYVDNLSENIQRGKRNRVKNGFWPSSAPMGYINNRAQRTLDIDPTRGPIVREMFELYATGEYTIKQLQAVMLRRGFEGLRSGTLSLAKIQNALTNPIYYGVMRFRGEFYDGKHEPLVTRQLFDRCREVMLNRGRKVYGKLQSSPWSGVLRCGECGAGITSEVQKGHRYFRCTKKLGPCSQRYVREELLMQQVRASLQIAGIDETFYAAVVSGLVRQADEADAATEAERATLTMSIAECDRRLHSLNDLFMEQALSVEEYREFKNRLVNDRRKHHETLTALTKKPKAWLEPAKRHLSDALHATYVASSGTDDESRRIMKNIGSNLTLRDRRLQWQPRGAWQLLVGQGVVEVSGMGRAGGGGREWTDQERKEGEWSGGDSNP